MNIRYKAPVSGITEKITVPLYNNAGESLRIDTINGQFVISEVSVVHAKRMIRQLEQYIADLHALNSPKIGDRVRIKKNNKQGNVVEEHEEGIGKYLIEHDNGNTSIEYYKDFQVIK